MVFQVFYGYMKTHFLTNLLNIKNIFVVLRSQSEKWILKSIFMFLQT